MNFLQAAEHYVARGFRVLPLKPGSKEPATNHGVHDATDNMYVLSEYARKVPDANIAVGCGPDSGMTGLVVIDIDKHHGGVESFRALVRKHGALPGCPMSRTPQGGFHMYFRHAPQVGNSQNLLGKGIDVKSTGGYVVLPPSHWDGHKNGEKVAKGGSYQWEREPLSSYLPAMPSWMLARLKPKPLPTLVPKAWDRSNVDLVKIAKALEFVSNHDYATWLRVGMALKSQFGDAGFDLWDTWSASGYANHDSGECRRKWASFRRVTGVSLGSIFHEARAGGADLKRIFDEDGGLAV
jgi:hypothetical protein